MAEMMKVELEAMMVVGGLGLETKYVPRSKMAILTTAIIKALIE